MSGISLEKCAEKIRMLYQHTHDEKAIEDYLASVLKEYSREEKISFIENLMSFFAKMSEKPLDQIFSIFLGEKTPNVSSQELLDRLTASLNALFDALNELIFLIEKKLLGKEGLEEKTIRKVIGEEISLGENRSLETYISQIKKAFLIAYESFKKTVDEKIGELLRELDPKNLESEGKGFKIGPLWKAELFNLYQEKFEKCKKWYESGRFLEDFLRKFEKNCEEKFLEEGKS